jgi:hypothetical protein
LVAEALASFGSRQKSKAIAGEGARVLLYASGFRPGGTGLVTAKDGQSPS